MLRNARSLQIDIRLHPAVRARGYHRVLNQTFGQSMVAFVIAAYKDFAGQFSAAGVKFEAKGAAFKICTQFQKSAITALRVARSSYPECEPFTMASGRKNTIVLSQKIYCGTSSLVYSNLFIFPALFSLKKYCRSNCSKTSVMKRSNSMSAS